MKQFFTALFILALAMPVQAQINKKVSGNGNMTTENRSVGSFDEIGVAGTFQVELVKGNEGDITVNAESNLMEYIETEVVKGKLKIKTKKGYKIKSSKKITLTVGFKNLNNVSLAGSGDVVSDDVIKSQELKISLAGSGDIVLAIDGGTVKASIAGSGDIKLEGKANDLTCAVAGSGDINASDLEAGTTHAKIAGSGNVQVHAVNSIKASIAGSGDVIYSGNPEVEKSSKAGSGSLKKKQ